MFQFLALQSRDGVSGFAPIVEFEVPTRSEGGSRINTLTGFTTTLTRSRVAFNTALHFNPREDMMDYSAGWVVAPPLSCRRSARHRGARHGAGCAAPRRTQGASD